MDNDTRARSPGSTIANSEMDERFPTPASSPTRTQNAQQKAAGQIEPQGSIIGNSRRHEPIEDEGSRVSGGPLQAARPKPPASVPRKRKEPPGGSIPNPSAYSGNKVKHLKKDDGEPLWRKDIQYDFLKAVFEDQQQVFTNSYEPDGRPLQTFANLYIDTMARSSKTSKILRDKLLTEHEPAKNMAMVCLLVNLGRMNTTLNFFPEMRAQLRTYHAIPSLQAHQDPNSYKQLQDAPRLKSILKGASEDRPEPNSLEKIKTRNIPRTNPVNLIFVLAQFAPRVTELHLPPGRDFYDLIMAENISSASRARAFLWLMWFYLESDFTEEGADENPFGQGVDYDVNVRNQGVPRFTILSTDQQDEENVDTAEEKDYGFAKMRERKRIIEADQAAFQAEHGPPKRGPKPKLQLLPDEGTSATPINRIRPKFEQVADSAASIVDRIRPRYDSDPDSTRSTTPAQSIGGMRMQSALSTASKGRGFLKQQIARGSSPAPYVGEPPTRRSRPLTAHQLAVERNRNQRVDYILSRGLRRKHHHAKKERKQEGAFWRALQRTKRSIDPFEDSEDEDSMGREPHPFREHGFGGLIQLEAEDDDFGEELSAYAAAFRRVGRRLDRWDAHRGQDFGVMGTNRPTLSKSSVKGYGTSRDDDDEDTEDERASRKHTRTVNSDVHAEDEEDLDDVEKEILGMGSEVEDDQYGDEELDDVERALLGIGGDETEVEDSD